MSQWGASCVLCILAPDTGTFFYAHFPNEETEGCYFIHPGHGVEAPFFFFSPYEAACGILVP